MPLSAAGSARRAAVGPSRSRPRVSALDTPLLVCAAVPDGPTVGGALRAHKPFAQHLDLEQLRAVAAQRRPRLRAARSRDGSTRQKSCWAPSTKVTGTSSV